MACAAPEEVNERLTCAICMEQFKEPKVLPCLHTYCKQCLVKLVKKQGSDHVITCPECRQDTKIVDGDVGKLQPNFWVNNFMTLMSMQDSISSAEKPLICEHCDSGESAVSRCTDCSVFLCEFCVTAHKRINAFKSHQMLSLTEVKKLGSKAFVKPAFCSKHANETLKLFCDTCQKTICRDCTIVDHHEHKYNFVADVAERERKVVQAILEETKAKDCAVEQGLKAVQAMESRVEAKIAEVSKEVDVFFDKQEKALEYLRANLKHDVTTQGQVKIKELGMQKEMLASSLAQLQSSVNFAERALADGDDMELLSMKQQLIQRLTQLNSSQIPCKPCNSDYLKLKVDKTISDIGRMVTLCYTPVDPTKCILSMVGGEEGVLYQTFAGQSVNFKLVVKDRTAVNQPDAEGMVHASVSQSNQQGVRCVTNQELPVLHVHEDQSYWFSYQPEIHGLCTLSVMVEGENVPGSPFMWIVQPEIRHTDELDRFLNLTPEKLGRKDDKGKHCWKLKYLGVRNCSSCQVEIGVSCIDPVNWLIGLLDKQVRRCSWCCQITEHLIGYSRSDNPHVASITSLEKGDIFSVFLNYNTRKLVIFNQRSRQADVFTGVKGEKVQPIISPLELFIM